MLQTFLITWVTHNSRISERMRLYEEVIIAHREEKPELGHGEPVNLTLPEELEVMGYMVDIIKESKYKVLALNICSDHVHMVIVCEYGELSEIVQKLKGFSSFKFRKNRQGVLTPGEDNYCKGLKPLVGTLWAQKFNRIDLSDEQSVINVCNYVFFNRQKHDLPEDEKLKKLIQGTLTNILW